MLRDWSAIAEANYPEPVEHCDVCRWWSTCDKRRRDDDHLSLVAGISRLQTRELQYVGIGTLAGLGALALPLPFKPRRGAPETYGRVREQARVQLRGRTRASRSTSCGAGAGSGAEPVARTVGGGCVSGSRGGSFCARWGA